MNAILMSIQPKWCELIANGIKTTEVRKTAPKETPFRVYMYCTKKGNLSGKVIGEFICDRVFELKINGDDCGNYWHEWDDEGDIQDMCLSYEELETYLRKSVGYGLRISELKIYDKPKSLGEFLTPYGTDGV